MGFLPADDPRVAGTIAAIRRELIIDSLVYRFDPGVALGGDQLPLGDLPPFSIPPKKPPPDLLQIAVEQDLTVARLTGIGALSRVVLGFFCLEKRAYRYIEIDEQVAHRQLCFAWR
jgi:hypothetical protein